MSAQPMYSDSRQSLSYRSSLLELTQAIEWGQGHFSLILAHCNSLELRRHALHDLERSGAFALYTISLPPDAEMMFSSIALDLEHRRHSSPASTHAGAIAIAGFERVNHIDRLLSSADIVRDELRNVFHCPLVWWMNDAVLTKLIRIAPNIHSWFTFVEFASEPDPLLYQNAIMPHRPPGSVTWSPAPIGADG